MSPLRTSRPIYVFDVKGRSARRVEQNPYHCLKSRTRQDVSLMYEAIYQFRGRFNNRNIRYFGRVLI